MPWFKVDDALAFHMKALAAGNTALGLWVRAGSWSSQQLTDGFVPATMVPALGGGHKDAKALVHAGLWHQVEGGFQFHQWEQYQPTREQVEAERAAAADRMRKVRAGKRSPERSPEQVPNVPTNEHGTFAVSSPSPSRPVPSHDLTKTHTRQSRPIAGPDSTDVSSITERLAAQHGVTNLALIAQAIAEHTGREVSASDAWRVSLDILQRAKRVPSSGQRYVLGAIRQSPFEVQQFIDREVAS